MGLKLFSSSTYDSDIKNPNPDPCRFTIKSFTTIGRYVIVLINYHDCSNFEGNKILVYNDVPASVLMNQESLDPHFSNNKLYHSPIARFQPTELGMRLAIDFCESQRYK